jgi:hypothetical protein
MKKSFTSLILGFGVTLAVLVAISMPPGSWAVVIGALIGFLFCVPLFIIIAVMLKQNNARRNEPSQPVQPIILVQPQTMPGYHQLPMGQPPMYYMPDGYQGYAQPHPQMYQQPQRGGKALPRRRKSQVSDAYYYEDNYPAGYFPEAYGSDNYQDYDQYYTQPADNSAYELEDWERVNYPKAKSSRRRSRDLTIDVDFRTLGD